MDDENYHNICSKAHSEADRRKVIRMANYFTKYKGRTSVPDPYYGDGEDFELALDLIEDGCSGMLRQCGVCVSKIWEVATKRLFLQNRKVKEYGKDEYKRRFPQTL